MAPAGLGKTLLQLYDEGKFGWDHYACKCGLMWEKPVGLGNKVELCGLCSAEVERDARTSR